VILTLKTFALYTKKRSHFHSGTVRANAFFRIDLFNDNRGTVSAFDFFGGKRTILGKNNGIILLISTFDLSSFCILICHVTVQKDAKFA
jgi:hypothetical protein